MTRVKNDAVNMRKSIMSDVKHKNHKIMQFQKIQT